MTKPKPNHLHPHSTTRDAILAVLALAGTAGLTDREIAEHAGLTVHGVRPVRARLATACLIASAGERHSAKGKPAVVWVVK